MFGKELNCQSHAQSEVEVAPLPIPFFLPSIPKIYQRVRSPRRGLWQYGK